MKYNLFDEISASDTEPLAPARQAFHLLRINEALRSIERSPDSNYDDWKVMCTVVNMLETLVAMGAMADSEGFIREGQRAIADAGQRRLDHPDRPFRFAGPDIQVVRDLISCYTAAVQQASARMMIRAHRITERRAAEALGINKKAKKRRRAVAVDF